MKEYLLKCIDFAKDKGCDYADIRIVDSQKQRLAVRNEGLSDSTNSETIGFGVRVLKNGAWGFAASSVLNLSEIERISALAVKIAKVSSIAPVKPMKFANEPAYQDIWTTPYAIDPFAVSLEDKLSLLFAINKKLRTKPDIKVAYSTMAFNRDKIYFANTEGSIITQVLLRSGAGYSAVAVKDGQLQKRSYPMPFGGQHKSGGYEIVNSLHLLENADRVRDEALALLDAEQCPSGKKTIILNPNQLFLQIHESSGHPTELDRVLGYEENFAGSSFLTTEKYKKYRYGSEIVNIVADGTVPTGLATRGYDDDGVRMQRYHVVKDGILTGYMTSREFAHVIGEEKSFGCNRSEGFHAIPIIRINNLSLMPGCWDFDDMIADTEDGLLLDMNKSWSIDQMRLNFQFSVEAAWEIKNGKLGKLFKNANYQSSTPEFWNSCDAIANESYWDLMGVNNCGKGEPMQSAEMSHGCSPARFHNITVGI
ncbi:MAG: TldD/PmbA family protein [Planctomycetes bacterium]|nr:TldD/PmbA family protein [Planctomycetota bacterium]